MYNEILYKFFLLYTDGKVSKTKNEFIIKVD